MEPPTCRPARDEDMDRLADLRVLAMRLSLEALGRFDPVRARRRFTYDFVAADTWVLLQGSDVAGFYVLHQRPLKLYLSHLYIDPLFHGRGLGSWVIGQVQAQARALAMPIYLLALQDSPVNEFYQAHGFSFVSQDAFDRLYVWTPPDGSGTTDP